MREEPEHFSIGPGYRDPLDPREDFPTDESEDREAERRYLQRSRTRQPSPPPKVEKDEE